MFTFPQQGEHQPSGRGGRGERRRRQVFSGEGACEGEGDIGTSRGGASVMIYCSTPTRRRAGKCMISSSSSAAAAARWADRSGFYRSHDFPYHHQYYPNYFQYYPQIFVPIYLIPIGLFCSCDYRYCYRNYYNVREQFPQSSHNHYSLGFYNTQEQQGGYYGDRYQYGGVYCDNQNYGDISSDCKENYDPTSNNQVEIDLSSSLKHIHVNEDTTTPPPPPTTTTNNNTTTIIIISTMTITTTRTTTTITTTTIANIDHQKGLDVT
uniref:Uncharacterized protein n=2 Tax=Trichobilharzia regenti TaxID=157069 RepID=A0AA85JIZ2_TRIRE|nr:unnamed protein product [Trichobilharzia regenti]